MWLSLSCRTTVHPWFEAESQSKGLGPLHPWSDVAKVSHGREFQELPKYTADRGELPIPAGD
jgi:hypothetical protein